MVSVSLLQRLEGDQAADRSRPSESAVMESILASMRSLLNSRQGCCEIRPDYGLTNFNATVENYRNAISLVARDVEKQIRLFEPRLRGVAVRAIEDKTRPLELIFHISGEIAYADRTVRVSFDSVLGSDGHMRFSN
jgi:type VI secretion system lysozyme-like protein